ncbi:hypothetical protein AMJ44_13680 [candidate division WOR-1 bacterium DG_54_3]|uniref:Uncharacterized protein n=1 Tax=candidate division WOR-1 bacterium DG_54_3 TaxID=1703775 RepID=A0A0S7XN95_UNCSA|nr:MAG: hypothetical protein AMJ44_13680 [candidate division WOR-1 bacterium DG_54_3]
MFHGWQASPEDLSQKAEELGLSSTPPPLPLSTLRQAQDGDSSTPLTIPEQRSKGAKSNRKVKRGTKVESSSNSQLNRILKTLFPYQQSQQLERRRAIKNHSFKERKFSSAYKKTRAPPKAGLLNFLILKIEVRKLFAL